MTRGVLYWFLAVGLSVSLLPAQEGIRRGTIKKVQADKGVLTIAVGGEDRNFTVTDATKMMDAAGQPVTQGLKDQRFKAGAKVFFKAMTQGNQEVLLGMKLAGDGGSGGGVP